MASPSLRLQTVLYENHPLQVQRFLESVSAAATTAQSAGVVGHVEMLIGDCSPRPVLSHDRLGPHVGSCHAVTYVHFGQNLGSAGGHNRLFESLSHDIAVVCNADTYASPRLLLELVAPFADPQIGIVEARQVPLEQPKVHDASTGETSWASGACLATRRAVIQATHGFDPGLFFLHGDDVDFSWRTKLAGWRVVHRPAATIFHDKRLTVDGNLETSDIEIVCGAEASVLLAYRYSRPDIAERNLAMLSASSDPRHQEAVARVRERQRADRMPAPLDADGKVAQFVGVDYAVHRFTLGA